MEHLYVFVCLYSIYHIFVKTKVLTESIYNKTKSNYVTLTNSALTWLINSFFLYGNKVIVDNNLSLELDF